MEKASYKTLEPKKVYLDSCVTCHYTFVEEILNNIGDANVVLYGHCNAGTSITIQKGTFVDLKIGLNKSGTANLLSIPKLEEYGYRVKYNMLGDWLVITPQGGNIKFK